MATRSIISYRKEDGTVESIYCHDHSELAYTGKILDTHYKDMNKVEELINLGDIINIGVNITPNSMEKHGVIYNKDTKKMNNQEGVVVAYIRDCGQDKEEHEKVIHTNLEEFNECFNNSPMMEKVYLFDKTNWFVGEHSYDRKGNILNKPIKYQLLSKVMIKYKDSEIKKPESPIIGMLLENLGDSETIFYGGVPIKVIESKVDNQTSKELEEEQDQELEK